MRDSVLFGDTEIVYAVRRSDQREDLFITVDGAQVMVSVPRGVAIDKVRSRVMSKAAWIVQKLDENRLTAKVYPKNLVSGESLHYLGRQYLLRLISGDEVGVKLIRGEMVLSQGTQKLVREEKARLLQDWYKSHLVNKLEPMVKYFSAQLNVDKPKFQVRNLGNRWGSCGKNGVLYFHWQLARLPLSKVEFVCAHEIVHLREPNHTKRFKLLLAKLLPMSGCRTEDLSL